MAYLPAIQLKRTNAAGKIPDDSDLAVGEIAINLGDNTLYTKDSDGYVVKLGFGYDGKDSDAVYYLDSEGGLISRGIKEAKITVVTDSDGDNWQRTPEMESLRAGTLVNIYREKKQGSGFVIEHPDTVGTEGGWSSVVSTDGIVDLDYNGVQSYAVTHQWFNTTYNVRNAYLSNGDFATSNDLNNMWYWQVFTEPVTIGDGTDLGSFANGRFTYNEYYNSVRVEFFDVNGVSLATQSWSSLGATGTRTINTAGTINNVRSVMFRAHLGNASNPGLNRIRLKVNGSNDYPVATAVDNRYGVGYRNMVGATNLADSDEVLCLCIVDAAAGSGVGGAWNVFRNNDWRPFITQPDPQVYTFFFNKPWAIDGGTFSNGRASYTNQFWDNVEWRYFNENDSEIARKDVSTPVYSTANELFHGGNVWRIEARPTGVSEGQPVIQRFFPSLHYKTRVVGATEYTEYPEVWMKESKLPYGDGLPATTKWKKISS